MTIPYFNYPSLNGDDIYEWCAHIESVIWYFGFATHNDVNYPSNKFINSVKDAGHRLPLKKSFFLGIS